MSDTKLFVLSHPPEGVSAEQFHDWYEIHVGEVLALEGFRSAERFALGFLRSSSGEPLAFSHLTVYEIEGDFDVAFQNLRDAVDSGRMYFPEWYHGVGSAGLRGQLIAQASAVPA